MVDDLAQPAFMQPPVPEGTLAKFRNATSEPDAIDVLVTSRNHDLKAARCARAEPEHWLFSLVSLQTMQGFLGAGKYGISRMNGGFASRPAVGLVTSPLPGGRFLRDAAVLLERREALQEEYPDYAPAGGLALLWLEPWDGTASVGLAALDLWYIEICRRVRLTGADGRLVARDTATKTARVAAKELNGNTGDPWTPVAAADGKALTISSGGFHYRLLKELLLGSEYRKPLMQELHPIDEGKEIALLVRALARGQGETNGYHERLLPIPVEVHTALLSGTPQQRRTAADLAQKQVDDAAQVRGVLRSALFALFQAGPDEIIWRHKESETWSRSWSEQFDKWVDDIFFDRLWRRLGEPAGDPASAWPLEMRDLALKLLREAVETAPVPSERHYRAVAAAERLFWGGFYKLYPDLRPIHHEKEEDHERAS